MPWNTALATETAFYRAFRELDLLSMSEIWSTHATDSYCIHPGGPMIIGHQSIVDSWAQIFSGSARPHIETQLLQQHQQNNLAVHVVSERVSPSGDKSRSSLLIATNIYRQEEDDWHLLGHHSSLPMVNESSSHRAVH